MAKMRLLKERASAASKKSKTPETTPEPQVITTAAPQPKPKKPTNPPPLRGKGKIAATREKHHGTPEPETPPVAPEDNATSATKIQE